MKSHLVKVHPEKNLLKKEEQLAWKMAQLAEHRAELDSDAVGMVINRIIDNAAVAVASWNRSAVITAREMALAHPRPNNGNSKVLSIFGQLGLNGTLAKIKSTSTFTLLIRIFLTTPIADISILFLDLLSLLRAKKSPSLQFLNYKMFFFISSIITPSLSYLRHSPLFINSFLRSVDGL